MANYTAALAYGLSRYYEGADETEKMIMNFALAAAGTDLLAGALPAISIPATLVCTSGIVWTMYIALCSKLGISIRKNVLKLLAKAALSNIGANAGGYLGGICLGMMIPGASSVVSSMVTFVAVYLAGILFLKMILKMAAISQDPYTFSDLSEKELKKAVLDTEITKEDLEAAKNLYTEQQTDQRSGDAI